MTIGAILTMILTMGIVTAVVTYFFIKVLKTPVKKNDENGNAPDG